jgi:hypothetical protein
MTIKYFCPKCRKYWVDDAHPHILPYKAGGFHYVDENENEIRTCPTCASKEYPHGRWMINQVQPNPRNIRPIPSLPMPSILKRRDNIKTIYKECNYLSNRIQYSA